MAIDENIITQGLSDSSIFHRVIIRESLDSTNDFLRRYGNPSPGLVVIAETQQRGRGKRDRKWLSPKGGLWMSFLLGLVPSDQRGKLSLAVVESLGQVISEFGVDTTVVWPNDLYVGNKKLGGVLIETYGRYCIVGVGANVNNNPAHISDRVDVTPTSVQEQTGRKVPLESIVIGFFRTFEDTYCQHFTFLDAEEAQT